MIYTPLKIGQRISPRESVMLAVLDVVNKNENENLAKGLLIEYEHNELFKEAGIPIELTATADVFDRKVDGLMQDDKLATWTLHEPTGRWHLSSTHTISYFEEKAWVKQLVFGKDVIIHSFQQVANDSMDARYVGAISFRDIRQYMKPSNDGKSFFFDRASAYKWSTVK